MTNTTILVWTSAKSAVRHATQHGWTRVDVDLSTWDDRERDVLAEYVTEHDGARLAAGYPTGRGPDVGRYHRAIDLADPTPEGLLAWVRKLLDRRDRADAAVAAELSRLRSLPVAELAAERRDGAVDLKVEEPDLAGLTLRDALGRALGRTLPPAALRVSMDDIGRDEEVREYDAAQLERDREALREYTWPEIERAFLARSSAPEPLSAILDRVSHRSDPLVTLARRCDREADYEREKKAEAEAEAVDSHPSE